MLCNVLQHVLFEISILISFNHIMYEIFSECYRYENIILSCVLERMADPNINEKLGGKPITSA